jgi:glycosyltransferase involved in cell wall biosynthesis
VTRPALSLVLPAFNEDANIARAVRNAAAAAGTLVADYEIVVVDDGSRDRTAAVLDGMAGELGPRLVVVRHPRNRGYGAALRSGFAATKGDLVFYTDSDNQFDLTELRDFLPLMADHDAVLGYRIGRQDPWTRRTASAFFNRLSSLAFGMSVRDLNCSFKLFRGDLLRSLPLESADFFIDTEMVARMHRGGWRYVQRGVRHFPRTAGRSTVRASDVPRTLAAIARFWFRLRVRPASRVTA